MPDTLRTNVLGLVELALLSSPPASAAEFYLEALDEPGADLRCLQKIHFEVLVNHDRED